MKKAKREKLKQLANKLNKEQKSKFIMIYKSRGVTVEQIIENLPFERFKNAERLVKATIEKNEK